MSGPFDGLKGNLREPVAGVQDSLVTPEKPYLSL